jgi:hypothetical protein
VRGVTLATAGLLLTTGVTIALDGGTRPWQLALVLLTVAVTAHGQLHPAAMIVAEGAAGIVLGR